MTTHLRALWERRVFILVGSIAIAALALGISSAMPKSYEAKATIIILPPRFSTELRPQTLPLETYRTIAESEGIKKRVRETLESRGVPSKGGQIEADLSTAVYPSASRDQIHLPLIDLIVRAKSADRAEMVAGVWADTILEESMELNQRASRTLLDFIEKEFRTADDRLLVVEDQLKVASDERDKRLTEAEKRWAGKIADFQAEWDLEGMKEELRTIRTLLSGQEPGDKGGLISQLQQVRVDTRRTRDALTELQKGVKAHPQFLVLAKAITNDALWDRIGKDSSGSVSKELEDLKLQTQELNPVYSRLAQRLAEVQVEYETLAPQEGFLEDQIAALRKKMEELNRLYVEKELEMENLVRGRELELERIKRETDLGILQLRRTVDNARKTYSTLAEKSESARLSKAEDDTDVKIGAPAAANSEPVSPKVLINTAVAGATGFVLMVGMALMLALFRDPPRRERSKPPSVAAIRAPARSLSE